MASLPALPSLTAFRRKPDTTPTPPADADLKLRIARRLAAEDDARRSTSVAPPATRTR